MLLQVVEPHGQRGAVVERGGWMDERVRQQLPALLHEQAALDGVAQHLLQQLHVLTLGLAVARLQERQVREQQRHSLLLGLLLPLAHNGCHRKTATNKKLY